MSVIGASIAAYLLFAEPDNASSSSNLFVCPGQSPHGIINCTAVATSRYSHILGIPLSLLALLWFLLLVFLSILQRRGSKEVQMLSAYLGIAGIFAVFYSSFAMFEIGHVCVYCSAIDVILLTLFFIGVAEARRLTQQLNSQLDK
ncbi:MAG: vitamin K epoxide reductase family protein [Candidatus Micrarchaeia archaeon]